jgi:hypothetical protein
LPDTTPVFVASGYPHELGRDAHPVCDGELAVEVGDVVVGLGAELLEDGVVVPVGVVEEVTADVVEVAAWCPRLTTFRLKVALVYVGVEDGVADEASKRTST